MTIDMSQFHEVFFEESAELLVEMERLLLEVDLNTPDKEQLNAIFRTAHSIKGGAGTFGFSDITETTHVLESLLDRLRRGELALRADMIDVFLQSVDVLKMQLAGRRSGAVVDVQEVAAIRQRLTVLADAKTQEASAESGDAEGAAPAADDSDWFGMFDDEPAPEGAAPTTPAEGEPGQGAAPSMEAEGLPLRRASDRVEISDATSIRVGVDKVDQLINLVGELVITQAILAQSVAQSGAALQERLGSSLAALERNTRDLQDSAMSIRMMPISFVFSRFPRVVRDLATTLGKQVDLKTVGENTELDKGLIERIADPLNHLVRNSLDHGIEMPDVRVAAGKNPRGTLSLRAFHQGGSIGIDVSDDGAGLDRAKILAKARERGMPVAETMSDSEVFQLIFEPGFSTAAVVTEVSGRGVGMDVVRRNIRSLGGSVDIASRPGLGATLSIRLPLTLAILDGMSVSVGGETFIIPLTYILESLQPKPGEVKTVAGQGGVVLLRGEYLPVVLLHEKTGLNRNALAEGDPGILVVLEHEGTKVALLVDDLVGQHQVVIKSLETHYRKVNGVSGATIMGDGKVALILDVAALTRGTQRHVGIPA